jgi:hypothetical protein
MSMRRSLARAGRDAVRTEHRGFHVRRVRDHRDDDLGPLGDLARRLDDDRAVFGEGLGAGERAVRHRDREAGPQGVAGHRRAHDPGADEADALH